MYKLCSLLLVLILGLRLSHASPVTEIFDLPGNGWIYTAPSGIGSGMYPHVIANLTRPAYLKMTDVFSLGDRFVIYINGTAVAITSVPAVDPTNTTTTLDANVAFAGPATWSNIWLPLPAGYYNITFTYAAYETQYPGVGAVRIDYVRQPTLLGK